MRVPSGAVDPSLAITPGAGGWSLPHAATSAIREIIARAEARAGL